MSVFTYRMRCIEAALVFIERAQTASEVLEKAETAEQTLLSLLEDHVLAPIFGIAADVTMSHEAITREKQSSIQAVSRMTDAYASKLESLKATTESRDEALWQGCANKSALVRCKNMSYALLAASEEEIEWHSFGWMEDMKDRCQPLVLVRNWFLKQIPEAR
jgi:hypothetical protein